MSNSGGINLVLRWHSVAFLRIFWDCGKGKGMVREIERI